MGGEYVVCQVGREVFQEVPHDVGYAHVLLRLLLRLLPLLLLRLLLLLKYASFVAVARTAAVTAAAARIAAVTAVVAAAAAARTARTAAAAARTAAVAAAMVAGAGHTPGLIRAGPAWCPLPLHLVLLSRVGVHHPRTMTPSLTTNAVCAPITWSCCCSYSITTAAMCQGALMEQCRSAVVNLVVLWQAQAGCPSNFRWPKKIGISGLNQDLRANQD